MDQMFNEDDLLSYVHGVAPDEIASRIEAHMEKDADFRAEITVMRSLKPTLEGQEDHNQPGEFGWRRLQAEMERESHKNTPPAVQHLIGWRSAAAVLGIIVLGQTFYIATGTTNPAQYHTASEAVEAHVLAARFAETATMAQISALIRNQNGQIIDGPSASGFYRLSFESGEALHAAESHLAESPLITLLATE